MTPRRDGFAFDSAIVRAPARSIERGLRTDPGASISFDAAAAEHAAYAAALEQAGLAVEVLPALEAFPDSVFVEDPALVFEAGAILLAPGARSRRSEAAMLEPALRRRFARVESVGEGCVDGGDVLVAGRRVFIGVSGRTDRAGAEALARILAGFDLDARIVATPAGVLHLKTGASLIDEATVLAAAPLAMARVFDGLEHLPIPQDETTGANVLRLNGSVLVSADAPRTADLLARRGLAVVAVSTREIGKLDAGLTCMSLRWGALTPTTRGAE